MRSLVSVFVVSVLAAACSDGGVTPSPTGLGEPPVLSADVTAALTGTSMCTDGSDVWSPCDGYDSYASADGGIQDRPASSVIGTGNPGSFFLPELVDNHKPFPGTFLSGLESFLSVKICLLAGPRDDPASCTEPRGVPTGFSEEVDFYSAKWKPSRAGGDDNDNKKYWRIYVVLGGTEVLAFRDVWVTDPSNINPADGEALSLRVGSNVNIKIAITDASGIQVGTCSATDSNSGTNDEDGEEALCLIPAGSPGQINLGTTCADPNGCTVSTTLGAQTFPLLINVDAQCDGDIETDLPLYGPCVEMSADMPAGEELVDSYIFFCNNGEPIGAPDDGAFVLQQSDDLGAGTGGTLTLPAVECPINSAAASELDGFWDLIAGGAEKVAGLLGARELIATAAVRHSGGGGSLAGFGSKFQLGGPAYLGPAEGVGGAELPTVVQQDEAVDVVVPVYGGGVGGVAPGTTVYFFSTQGAGASGSYVGDVDCPDDGTYAAGRWTYDDGAVCDDSGAPVIYTTGSVSEARAVWTPGSIPALGGTTVDLRMLCAGCAVEGSDTPINNGGSIDGLLQDAVDRDRNPFGDTGYHNGPIDGVVDAFEPIDHFTDNAVAHNDLAMVRSALVCGDNVAPDDVTDGVREAAWDCAGEYKFTAKIGGGKTQPDNASLLWTHDGTNLYVAIEIRGAGAKDLNDAFFYFDNDATAGPVGGAYVHGIHEGDDVVVMRLDDPTKVTADHFAPAACDGSPKASLCSAVDATSGDQTSGAASVDGANLFWEFSKALNESCPNDEDFCLGNPLPDYVGVAGTITGGKGGSKGGNEVPGDDQYILIEIK
jgi:hypothetical protein